LSRGKEEHAGEKEKRKKKIAGQQEGGGGLLTILFGCGGGGQSTGFQGSRELKGKKKIFPFSVLIGSETQAKGGGVGNRTGAGENKKM